MSSASQRIQWLHKKIVDRAYPNAYHLAERFRISHRQAQRDVDYLRHEMGAPLAYSAVEKGYYYSESFTFPLIIEAEGDVDFNDAIIGMKEFGNSSAERSVLQLQLPYYATLEIKDRMTVLNLRSLIVADEPHHRYRCEFPSVELFLGIIMSTGAEIKVVSPDWLRERLVEFAHRVLRNNEEEATNDE